MSPSARKPEKYIIIVGGVSKLLQKGVQTLGSPSGRAVTVRRLRGEKRYAAACDTSIQCANALSDLALLGHLSQGERQGKPTERPAAGYCKKLKNKQKTERAGICPLFSLYTALFQQLVVSRVQRVAYSSQLHGLNVLYAALDFYKALARHVHAILFPDSLPKVDWRYQ